MGSEVGLLEPTPRGPREPVSDVSACPALESGRRQLSVSEGSILPLPRGSPTLSSASGLSSGQGPGRGPSARLLWKASGRGFKDGDSVEGRGAHRLGALG